MQKQRLCYKTNDLLYSARIYKSLMSFTTPWEPYLGKKNKTQQNSKTDYSWRKNKLCVNSVLWRYNTSQLKIRRREVTWDEKGIRVWECLIGLQHLGLRRSQDIEWGCSGPVSIECMLAAWVMRNLEPKSLPCSNSDFLTCWFFFFFGQTCF